LRGVHTHKVRGRECIFLFPSSRDYRFRSRDLPQVPRRRRRRRRRKEGRRASSKQAYRHYRLDCEDEGEKLEVTSLSSPNKSPIFLGGPQRLTRGKGWTGLAWTGLDWTLSREEHNGGRRTCFVIHLERRRLRRRPAEPFTLTVRPAF